MFFWQVGFLTEAQVSGFPIEVVIEVVLFLILESRHFDYSSWGKKLYSFVLSGFVFRQPKR
jgi:hypothetical protein